MKIKRFLVLLGLASLLVSTGCVPETFQYDKQIGGTGSGKCQFLGATDLDITKDGYLVVADAGNSRFQVIDPSNNSVLLTGGNETANDNKFKIKGMMGIGVDRFGGHIWVCDKQSNKIVRYNGKDGTPDKAINKGLNHPMDVAIDKDGNLYVLQSRDSRIHKFDGTTGKAMGTPYGGEGPAALVYGTTLSFSPDYKHLYITDYGGKRIVVIDAKSGKFVSDIKAKGEHEELIGPSCVFIDETEKIYLLDLGDIPVVLLDKEGKVISKIGSVGSGKVDGQMIYPSGIVARNDNEIFVLDNSKNMIIAFKKKPTK